MTRSLALAALLLLVALPGPARAQGATAASAPGPEAAVAAPDAPAAAAGGAGEAGVAGPDGEAPPPPARAETPWDHLGEDPVGQAVRTAWSLPASSLDERVERTLRTGLAMGFRDLEAPARALLFADAAPGTGAVDRARAAVRLAPDLPATRAALAHALLFEARDPLGALGELVRALQVLPDHLEAWLWTRATVLHLAAVAALASGLLFLLVAGGALLPRLGRQLLGRLRALPPASRFAAAAALVLVPASFGEGLLGVALALTAVGCAYGTPGRRLAVLAAAGLVVAGLHPLADAAARARSAVLADPVVLAASAAEVGLPTADELARVARRAADDPLAARAMALRDKRAGRLAEAREAYARLLAAGSSEGRLYNNAANVALALDHQEEAIALYEKAVALDPGPAILFNLSQAYGRAVRLDAQDLALAQAQELDPDAVAELTNLFSAYSPLAVVDLPVRVDTVAPRLVAPLAAHRLAIDFRRRVAPAGATRTLEQTAALFGLAALAGLALGLVLRRVAGDVSDDDHYADIARLLQRRGTDPGERMRRLDALRARQARVRRLQLVLAFVMPGAAGLLVRRAALAWLGCVCFAGAATLWLLRAGVVPDPLAVGPLPVLVGGAALAALALVYLVALAMALSLREKA